MAYFWEDWELMCWLADERLDVYHAYIDRLIERVRKGRMPEGDMIRFRWFLGRMKEENERKLARLKKLVHKVHNPSIRLVSD